MRSKFTYIVIDTLNYELSNYALQKSQERFPVSNVLVFSDDPARWPGHSIIRISEIRSTATIIGLFFELPKYLETGMLFLSNTMAMFYLLSELF